MNIVALAGCVIVDEKGRLLLVHRYTDKFQHWELPGGKVEAGETSEQAAIREVKEELGVRVKILKELGGTEFEDKTGQFHYSWFLANINTGKIQIKEPHIFDKFGYFELQALENQSISGNMQVLLPKLLNGEIKL